jgi:hypothetical protein
MILPRDLPIGSCLGFGWRGKEVRAGASFKGTTSLQRAVHMLTRRFIGVLLLLGGCIALAGGQQEKQPLTGAPEAQKTAAELRQQLVATAEEGRRVAEGAYRAGQGTADQMLAWTARWAEARLAAATNRQERIDALKEAVKGAQDRERDAQGRQRAGIATPTDLLAARYARIEAELALATEQAK